MKKIILLCELIFFVSALYPQQLSVDAGKRNSIRFLANSTLSNFEGETSAVEGSVKWDSILTSDSKIEFRVYLDSLDTGIGLRNKHMREKYLETGKFPFAEFKGRIINAINKSKFESDVDAEGYLKIHGIERKQKIMGKLYEEGSLIKLESSFDIFLSDFNIKKPSFLFTSVDNKVTVVCIIYLTRGE